jgi:1-aminocyclopropane-1-carboxylate deaminase/D-cysteine desulfhydrase-like pyridoxal-dependent ACC family enzyme
MANADLDVVIRQLAKQQNKDIMAAAKSRREQLIGLAAKAKDSETKERYKQIAKNTMLQGAATAKRLQIAADNAADSYARSMRNTAQAPSRRPRRDPAIRIGKEGAPGLKRRAQPALRSSPIGR